MWSEFSDRSTFVCAIEPALTNFYDPNKELNEAREFKQKSAITKLGSHLAKKISDMSHRGMSNRNRTFQESGKAVAVVHARPEEILAWTWFFCSNARTQLHTKVEGNLLRRQYEPTQEGEMNTREKTLFYLDDNTRSTHYCMRKAMTAPFKTRESNMR